MGGTILVTGGAGYIGSHVCKSLAKAGYIPVTFDNLTHGHSWAVQWGPLCVGDLGNRADLDRAFNEYCPEGVIHLAGAIHLRESIENPHKHYLHNVSGTLSLADAMVRHQVSYLVYSSSAAVYSPCSLPVDENHLKAPLNPYGKSKWMAEELLADFHLAHHFYPVALRYFNAAGADLEGQIGEAHNPETHLIPRLIESVNNPLSPFTIYNHALPTPDGTAVRDYVHVVDLAKAHVLAFEWVKQHRRLENFNLGTGKGHSVLETIHAVEKQTGGTISLRLEKREIAEPPLLVANPKKAGQMLGWSATHSDLETIIETARRWHDAKAVVARH